MTELEEALSQAFVALSKELEMRLAEQDQAVRSLSLQVSDLAQSVGILTKQYDDTSVRTQKLRQDLGNALSALDRKLNELVRS